MKIISIRGVIVPTDDKWVYDWFEMESTCPRDIASILLDAAGEEIALEINSKGGDVQAGVEMYTLLADYKGAVHSKIISWCFSAATFPACAGTCEVSPGGLYLVHNVQNTATGDYRAMNQNSELLQTANKAIAAIYQKKSGKTQEELLALMDEDRVMTGQEAVDAGFVDQIMFQNGATRPLQLAASIESGLLSGQVIQQMKMKSFPRDGKKAALLKANLDILELLGGKKHGV